LPTLRRHEPSPGSTATARRSSEVKSNYGGNNVRRHQDERRLIGHEPVDQVGRLNFLRQVALDLPLRLDDQSTLRADGGFEQFGSAGDFMSSGFVCGQDAAGFNGADLRIEG
jgi:hypothetical protein